MKKKFLLGMSLLCGLFLYSCRHDDMWDSINDLKTRVTVLEGICKTTNTNISSLQTIVQTSENHDYVTGVNEITKDGEVTGYIITFAKSKAITLYVGSEEVYVPTFTVEKGSDGNYYWMLDGKYVSDQDGKKVCANGKDGQNGSDGSNGSSGSDGKDGITPTLKIEKGVLYASYDTGKTWKELGKVAGADGQSGSDGADGITPQLKVEKGVLYVSYDKGETWINQGNVTGSNGSDGQDGVDGKDGVTPRLKIEDDYWYVSYDQEKTWTKLSKATGEKGESVFTSLKQNANSVTLTLSDGTELVLLKGTVTNEGVNGSDFIHFDDVNVKQICLQNWDTNHDNELSYDEAAAVEEINRGIFTKESDIRLFCELQYFTGLKRIGDECFYYSSHLSRIEFPSSLESIGDRAFAYTNLDRIELPQNVKQIGTGFLNATSMMKWVDLSRCELLESSWKDVFHPYINFIELKIPSTNSDIDIHLETGTRYVEDNRRVELMGEYKSFKMSVPQKGVYQKSISFYIHSTEPSSSFELSIDSYNPCMYTIYVPRDYVEDYKSAWSEYADHIAPYDYE